MPKSRKRKLTTGQRIKGALRRARIEVTNKEKVMPIYARAFPEAQDYQPFAYEEPKPLRVKPSLVPPKPPAPGSLVTTRDGVQYKVQPDGSRRALNKPRSRVKRLREGMMSKAA